jgi:ubiquinone/menaquinone biosynthesis C-methylase UbiE
MRLGVIPESLWERLLVRSPRFPQPLYDVMGTMLVSRAVMAGVALGVFDRLASAPRTAVELATEIQCPEHGIALLLDALAACRYLEEDGGHYRNAPLAARWLVSANERTLANFVRYNYDQWDWVSRLEDYLRHGEARDIHEKLDEPRWRSYLLGLRDIATVSAEEIIGKLRFTREPQSLLDVGAGHCYYSLALCRRYPALHSTVVDLEPATRVGRELVERAGLASRFAFCAGNLSETPFGGNHDATLLFNVVHHLDEATNRATFRRVLEALAPGGQLVVWETFREEAEKRKHDQVGALLGLFFGLVSRRKSYSFSEVAAWARAAGFPRIGKERLRTAPGASLLIATK